MAAVAMFALLQAVAAGAAAVATREAFAALADDNLVLPLFSLVLIAASGIAIALFRWSERVVAERLGQDFAAAVRLKLFKHIARLPANELAKRRTGGLSLRFVGDLASVRSWVSRGMTRLLSAAIVIPIVGAVLFHINPDLAKAALLPIALGLVAVGSAGPALLQAHRRLRRRRARLAADVTERLPHAAQLRLLGRLRRERSQIERRTGAMIDAVIRRQRRSSLIRAVPDAAAGLAIALMLWVASTHSIPGAEAAGAIAALSMLVQKMRELGSVWDRYCAWSAARARCLVLLAVRPLPGTMASGKSKNHENRPVRICLSNVSGYGFEQIDAVAEPGQKIGITGPNGAGKSSLLRLVAGMERPLRGRVELDRIPAVQWVGSVQKRILYIGPEAPILAGSLRRALTMGLRSRPDDGEVESVARTYGLENVLKRLGGLRGRVAERGGNLSSGEIQRVLLTRAALAGGDLLLLDEFDNAMDCEGIALVRKLVLTTASTVLAVSHDAIQLGSMDKVWLLERGKLSVIEPRIFKEGPLAEERLQRCGC